MTAQHSMSRENKKMRQEATLLRDYTRDITPTDMLPPDNLHPVLLGLFGEVGSVMAVAKKHRREKEAYPEHQRAAEEEFGDVLWYFVTLCRRLCIDVDTIFPKTADGITVNAPSHSSEDQTLLKLGKMAAALLDIDTLNERTSNLLVAFADAYGQAIREHGISLPEAISMNTAKVRGRFIDSDQSLLPTFDHDFPTEERIPSYFEIKIIQRKSGQSYMQWNGVFIGDPLSDNISEPDGFRFHDVFHLAHAAVLHWSPTFRALIKQKRKSVPVVDRTEDSGRAIVIEEGLTAWIFSRAKQLDFLNGQNSVSFDLLKTIQQFVRGYEVEQCPLKLWERAILQGYEVFRQLLHNRRGVIVGNRESRSISYRVN